MGNSQIKQFKKLQLGEGKLNSESCLHEKMLTEQELKVLGALKSKSAKFSSEGGDLLLSIKWTFLGNTYGYYDTNDNVMCIVVAKTGFVKDETLIYRSKESFKNQIAAENKKTDDGDPLYLFSKIETERGLSSATSTYSILLKDGEFQPIYTGKKLSALNYFARIDDEEGTPIAKVTSGPFSFKQTNGVFEVSSSVDLCAVVIIALSLIGSGGSSGALAGAGVV